MPAIPSYIIGPIRQQLDVAAHERKPITRSAAIGRAYRTERSSSSMSRVARSSRPARRKGSRVPHGGKRRVGTCQPSRRGRSAPKRRAPRGPCCRRCCASGLRDPCPQNSGPDPTRPGSDHRYPLQAHLPRPLAQLRAEAQPGRVCNSGRTDLNSSGYQDATAAAANKVMGRPYLDMEELREHSSRNRKRRCSRSVRGKISP